MACAARCGSPTDVVAVPITLDVSREAAERLEPGGWLALRDPEGVMLAALDVAEIWKPDPAGEAEAVFGTGNAEHPGVRHLLHAGNPVYVAGASW